MIDRSFEQDPGRDAAVLFLCHHAIELHLKAGILAKGERPPNTHDLADLDVQYTALHPRHPIQVPEIIKYLTQIDAGLFPDTTKGLKGKLHERLRYAAKTDGRDWPDLPKLNPRELQEQITGMRKQMAPVFIPIVYGSFRFSDS